MAINSLDHSAALVDLVAMNLPVNSARLFRKAEKLAAKNNMLAGVAGNAITLFTMFVLKEILVQQALNPVANISNIISIANAIANLNSELSLYSINT
ncbi:MAG: hypothetical protein H6Q75_1654 [Firmicutes bacterium]|nr:hypothetical protein [Bacillota bacterium]